MSPPTVLRVLVLSTRHLSEESVKILDGACADSVLQVDAKFSGSHHWCAVGGGIVLAVPDIDGWWMYAHDESVGMPDDLWACCEFAHRMMCDWIRFDCTADSVRELPIFCLKEGYQ